MNNLTENTATFLLGLFAFFGMQDRVDVLTGGSRRRTQI